MTSRDTPIARAMRTLLAAVAGYAGTWATLDWVTDGRASTTIVVINLTNALLAGSVAYLQAWTTFRPRTVLGKVFASFAQVASTGLATVAFVDLSAAGFTQTGKAVVSVLVAAAFTALGTMTLNAAEDAPQTLADREHP